MKSRFWQGDVRYFKNTNKNWIHLYMKKIVKDQFCFFTTSNFKLRVKSDEHTSNDLFFISLSVHVKSNSLNYKRIVRNSEFFKEPECLLSTYLLLSRQHMLIFLEVYFRFFEICHAERVKHNDSSRKIVYLRWTNFAIINRCANIYFFLLNSFSLSFHYQRRARSWHKLTITTTTINDNIGSLNYCLMGTT